MRAILTYLFLTQLCLVQAQELKIGILRSYSVSKIEVKYLEGVYELYSNSEIITSLWSNQSLIIRRNGNKISASKGDQSLGTFDTLYLREKSPNSAFQIQCLAPSSHKARKYRDNLMIVPEGSDKLTVINEVEMHNYLAGVIESEGGGGKHIEYYKVQAILSRTYALDHLNKHKKEGFHLCDIVHCQAYHNMQRFTKSIEEAVLSTRGLVMVTPELDLAKGFFFANCGGQTSESDFVWNESVPYCRSVRDTFCIHSKQATWTTKIPKYKWKAFLTSEFGFPIQDSLFGPLMYTFQQEIRHAFYLAPQLGIPLRDLRTEFKLKSTWFSCHEEGDQVVLQGRGFGHGVGLCQEGAMRMANLGFNYEHILNFYFTGIRLMNYYQWLFLMQRSEAQSAL